MNRFIRIIVLFLTVFTYGQKKFTIQENGLNPEFSVSKITSITKNEIYKKTLTWLKENEKKYKISIIHTIENEVILISSFKGNAVSLHNQYYHIKYLINISFNNNQYKFEPSKIQLKINSKYDMGWKDFSLTDSKKFFKKGKIIRKHKSYIKDLLAVLNELNIELYSYLKNKNN